jgi:predicted TIM-barrel fold metal-dependent hydrolase
VIVDAWCQHPTPAFLAYPMFATLRRWIGNDGTPMAIPDDLTAQALAAIDGVGLLSAWHGPQGALIPNDAVAARVAEAPDRLVGIASVDLRRPMDAVRELRRCVKQLGFKGLRMLPWLWELPPDDRRYYPLYAECIELDIPFCTQVGHAGPLRPSEPGRPIPYLDVVACEFPELRIVAGHVGVPWLGEMLSMLRKYDQVYVDTSAWAPRRFPAELVDYLKGRGRTKVLFGTNWPMLVPAVCVQEVEQLGLDNEAKAAFLGGNAARVFKL